MRLLSLCLLASLALWSQVRPVVPKSAPPPAGPLNTGVFAGDYLYVSAQGPGQPSAGPPPTFEVQVRQTLDNVKGVVEAAGLTMDHVVYTHVYLDNMDRFDAMNRVYRGYFPHIPPARATLGVARLPGGPIAISAVAVRDASQKRAVTVPGFEPNEPISPGILTRDCLFISGMAGRGLSDGAVPSDPREQAVLALDGLKAVSEAAGLSMAHLVFVNPYLTTAVPMGVMNQEYARRFEFGNTPARATIEVSGVPHGSQIEFTAVAVRDLSQRRAVRPKNMAPSPTASPCVFAGDTLYCSAKSGFIPGANGGIFAATVEHQLRQTMRNLLDNLEEAGLQFTDVVSTNVYLDDLGDARKIDPVYAKYFRGIAPARTDVQQLASRSRAPNAEGIYPTLEQISLIAARPPSSSQVVLTGSFADTDAGNYRLIPFEVPPGVRRLNVDLSVSGADRGALVTVGISDPVMFRGSGRPIFTISEADATPPFNPGPLTAGTWNLILGASRIPSGEPVRFEARVSLSGALDPATRPVLRRQSGWYKGDLHSHTGHSDGSCTSQSGKVVPCPAHNLVAAAAARGLDFLAITDHNTNSTFHFIDEMQPYYDKLLILHGREMTTLAGHANVWGTSEFLEYKIGFGGWTINQFFDQVHTRHALVSINHALWPNDATCPGCGWGWKDQTDFSKVDAIEAINGYNDKQYVFKAPPGTHIPFWEEQLARGHRITAVGGGDDHHSGEQIPQDNAVGRPTTVVFAEELSETGILAGIRAGRVYIKANGPDGPDLILTSGSHHMGDNLRLKAGDSVPFEISTKGAAGLTLVIVEDGKVLSESAASITRTYPAGRHWLRAELRDPAGKIAAMTNPIYINFE